MDYIKEIRKYIGHKTLLYPCATALIINKNNEVLLEKRSDDNKYGYIGGMIEVDENIILSQSRAVGDPVYEGYTLKITVSNIIDALKREIKEETNLDVISYSFFNIYSGIEFHHVYPNNDEISPIDIVFIVKDFKGTLKPQEGEVKSLEWFKFDSLPSNLNHITDIVIKDYLANNKMK